MHSASLETAPMPPEAFKPLSAFGFLTVVEDPSHGYFGGYLIVSERGQPVEFHCTTPVQPSQAQRILHGVSLRPYLLGEIIGQTLLAKARVPVQAVVTDLAEVLSLGANGSTPVAWLRHNNSPESEVVETSDTPSLAPEIVLGGYRLSGMATCGWQAEWLRDTLSPLAAHIDLAEPFERIREAIREAQRVTDHPGESEHESTRAA